MGKTSLEYYCNNCHGSLTDAELDLNALPCTDYCPFCGIGLSKKIQKQSIDLSSNSFLPVFKKASSISRLTLDIPKLDEILHFLTLNDKVCISGVCTQKLIERICVRAQLSHRYGGLDSKVLLVDGANSSDLYQCVDFARQYGLDVNKILDGIISSRAFTIYQLAHTIIKKLHHAIKQYNTRIVVVTNLLNYFTDSPFLDSNEMKTILKEIIQSLHDLQHCLVIVSLKSPTQYDYLFSKFFTRCIDLQQHSDTLSVQIQDDDKQTSLLLHKSQLEIILQH